MSELHKFVFDGLAVRGLLVRLTDAWQELLQRRRGIGEYPEAVRDLLGEMTAAATLMQSNIKFNGALVLQVSGDGPVKLLVAEVQPNLRFRATAKVTGDVGPDPTLQSMLNPHGQARCAITLDPADKLPGRQPYQGIVPLVDAGGAPLNDVAAMLEHYLRQSEQLESRLVLAADAHGAAGLLIQRLPAEGGTRPAGPGAAADAEGEDFRRIAHLASTLTRAELLSLDATTLLRRLFWEEPLRRFQPLHPSFACSCSRERVGAMLGGLGRREVDEILDERGEVEVGCDFCGRHYRFDAVDAATLFTPVRDQPPGSATLN